mmetsp:Transcript_18498/g.30837  ORF Transcript_18498/g.30837 Transcript_18498/m.30837 type:complete len:205 (-) Transcript_18498:22-636(-)
MRLIALPLVYSTNNCGVDEGVVADCQHHPEVQNKYFPYIASSVGCFIMCVSLDPAVQVRAVAPVAASGVGQQRHEESEHPHEHEVPGLHRDGVLLAMVVIKRGEQFGNGDGVYHRGAESHKGKVTFHKRLDHASHALRLVSRLKEYRRAVAHPSDGEPQRESARIRSKLRKHQIRDDREAAAREAQGHRHEDFWICNHHVKMPL